MTNDIITATAGTVRTLHEPAVAIWDRVDPMAFIERMGLVFARSGAGGCKTKEDGELMALACLAKRMDIFEINAEYHLMDGKLAVKADAMHARFRKAGGKTRWLKDGSDGKEASLELIDRDGNKLVSTFTIDMAQRAGLIKDKGNWVKWPAQMLRSRCITDGIRMQWPEISGGHYSDDELNDVRESDSVTVTTASTTSSPQRKTRQPAMPVKEAEDKSKIIETTAVPKTEPATTEKPPFDTDAKPAIDTTATKSAPVENFAASPDDPPEPDPTISDAAPVPPGADATFQADLMEIESMLPKLGVKADTIVAQVNKQKGLSASKLDDFPAEQLAKIREVLRAKLDQIEAANVDSKS